MFRLHPPPNGSVSHYHPPPQLLSLNLSLYGCVGTSAPWLSSRWAALNTHLDPRARIMNVRSAGALPLFAIKYRTRFIFLRICVTQVNIWYWLNVSTEDVWRLCCNVCDDKTKLYKQLTKCSHLPEEELFSEEFSRGCFASYLTAGGRTIRVKFQLYWASSFLWGD
jgi:hypothetical protein